MNSALCEEQFADPKDRDINNEAFWQKRMGKWWITGSIQQKDYLRAIQGNREEKPEILDDFPKDSDGSAKFTLIAIDRSIAA